MLLVDTVDFDCEHAVWVPLSDCHQSIVAACHGLRVLHGVLVREDGPDVGAGRVKEADASVFVGDDDVALHVGADSSRPLQPLVLPPPPAQLRRQSLVDGRDGEEEVGAAVKDLHGVVAGVGDDDVVEGVDSDVVGVVELGGSAPRRAEEEQALSVRLEDADGVVEGVGDDELSTAVDDDAVGPAKLALAELASRPPSGGVEADALTQTVGGGQQPLSRRRHPKRLHLALGDGRQRLPCRVKQVQPVVGLVDGVVGGDRQQPVS